MAIKALTRAAWAYAPAPALTSELHREAEERIIAPVLAAEQRMGCPFTGVLYCGLMLTEEGPKVVEFNARFGDPNVDLTAAHPKRFNRHLRGGLRRTARSHSDRKCPPRLRVRRYGSRRLPRILPQRHGHLRSRISCRTNRTGRFSCWHGTARRTASDKRWPRPWGDRTGRYDPRCGCQRLQGRRRHSFRRSLLQA